MNKGNLIRKITMCRCPICNRYPKAYSLKENNNSYIVTLECKPILQQSHKKVIAFGDYEWIAIYRAINSWNNITKDK